MARSSSLGGLGRAPPPLRAALDIARPAARPPPSPPTEAAVPVPERALLAWNGAMCAFHLALAVTTLALANLDLTVDVYRTSLRFEVYLPNGSFVSPDAASAANRTDAFRLVPYYEEAGTLNITLLTASFFLLSALFHLLNATLLRRLYLRELARCRTPTRWTEYFFSAPVMFVLIAYGLGVRDRATLLATAALIAATMPFGYWTEVAARPRSADAWEKGLAARLFPWALGHVPQAVAWAVVILQFYDNGWDMGRVPWFVYVILWAELALFSSFAAASLLSQAARPALFYRGEILFQVLSLVSKGLLGALLLSNVLMLSRFEDIYEEA